MRRSAPGASRSATADSAARRTGAGRRSRGPRRRRSASSAAVSATKAASPSRTVSGSPTNERRSIAEACSFSRRRPVGLDVVDRRGSRPRGRGRCWRSCCGEVKSRRASASVSAAIAFAATIAYGCGELLRGPEVGPVGLEGGQERVGREVRREGVGQAEQRRDLRAEEARPEDPERHVGARPRDRPHALARLRLGQVALKLHDVLREASALEGSRRSASIASGRCREPVRARGRSGPDERLERPELLGDQERRVVREHDPARADPDRLRPGRDVPITTAVAALAIPTVL